MQQYVKQLSLICAFGASTIMAGSPQQDQFGADIRQLAVQLTDIANAKFSESSRVIIRDLLIEFRQIALYQIASFKQGKSLRQLEADEKIVMFRDAFGPRVQALWVEIATDLDEKDELTDVVMEAQDLFSVFFTARQEEIKKLSTYDESKVKKQLEYMVLAVDTMLAVLQ
jgi:hypothetical protein